ncbi:MAG: hypothetical protein H6712_29105 [Myxococcales bacterium]|nr:hypothetical protein [Myxococcales bacterium]MCB9717943.1 hypothetical protein [Myxococcales bacterium]
MTPCLRAPHPRVLALLLGCSVAACNPGEPQDSSGGTGSTTSDDSGPSTGPSSTSASTSLDGTTTITDATGPGSEDDGSTGTGDTVDTGESTDTGETGNPDAPGPVIDLRALPSDASVYALWTLPGDDDLAGVLVARAEGVPVDAVPVDGTSYLVGDPIGNAEVVFATDGLNLLDLPLDNGTTYHYRAWAYDLDGNYSVGSADDATPLDARPTGLSSHEVPMGGEINGLRFAFDAAEQPHVALRVTTAQDELRYATCTGGCDAPGDWQVALVDTGLTQRPGIALDELGRPRITYALGGATYFARCDSNCGVGANWSTVALVGTSGATSVIDVDAGGRTWIAGGTGQLDLSWCDNGCTNAANWSTITLPGSYFYKHELQHTSSDEHLLVASRYEANYSTRVLRCTGACEDPGDWSEDVVANTAGSVYTLDYRFTADELGARALFPHDGRYFECEDCAPAMPPMLYDFTSSEVYDGGYLRLDAEDQPRIFARQSSGGMDYVVCDYDCGTGANWLRVDELLPSSESIAGFVVGSDGMPIAVGHAYFSPTGLRLYRGTAP